MKKFGRITSLTAALSLSALPATVNDTHHRLFEKTDFVASQCEGIRNTITY